MLRIAELRERQIKIYPAVGLNRETVGDTVIGELSESLNMEYSRGKANSVSKRLPTDRLYYNDWNRQYTGIREHNTQQLASVPIHESRFNTDKREEVVRLVNIQPDITPAVARLERAFDMGEEWVMKPFEFPGDQRGNPWGIGMGRTPYSQMLVNNAQYQASPLPDEYIKNKGGRGVEEGRWYPYPRDEESINTWAQMTYLFCDKFDDDNSNKVLFQVYEGDTDAHTYSLTSLAFPDAGEPHVREHSGITYGGITYPGVLKIGTYGYRFLYEDFQGNVGSFHEMSIHKAGDDRASLLEIDVGYYLSEERPGLRFIHVFRTSRWPVEFDPIFNEGRAVNPGVYYHVMTFDVFRSDTIITRIDCVPDSELNTLDVIDAYYNGGMEPKYTKPPNLITCGCLHLDHLFTLYGNEGRASGRGLHRTFYDDNLYRFSFPQTKTGQWIHSSINRMYWFFKEGIYVWYGRSVADMQATRPQLLSKKGILENTVREHNDIVYYVDIDGYPKMILGDVIKEISNDNNPKVKIPNTGKLNSIIIDGKYRVSNNEHEYVFDIRKQVWSIWDINVKNYMDPPVGRDVFEKFDPESDEPRRWMAGTLYQDDDGNIYIYGVPEETVMDGDHCNLKLKTAYLPIDCQMISLSFYTGEKDADQGPSPRPYAVPKEHLVYLEVFCDNEQTSRFLQGFTITSEMPGEDKTYDFMVRVNCSKLSVRFTHSSGEDFHLNWIGVTPWRKSSKE